MAKKIRTVLKLDLPAGKATPAPPVGTALGPHGINIVEFTKAYNERTADKAGQIIPAQITIFEDRSFTFILKTPPAAGPAPQGGRNREGRRDAEARDRRPGLEGPDPRDRGDQDGRPQRQRRRGGDEAGRGHRPLAWASRSSARAATTLAGHTAGRTPRAEGRPERRPTERNRDMAHGKKYLEAAKLVDRERIYSPEEAAQLAKDTTFVSVRRDRRGPPPARRRPPPRRPDGPRHGRPAARHRQGRPRRGLRPVGDKAQEALRAGADEVGGEDLVKKVEAGWLEFDVALATPDAMGMVGKLGKILGRRGLMPNPKAGTITFDLERAVREVKGGRVEFKVDKSAIIHIAVRQDELRGRRARRQPRRARRRDQPRQAERARRATTCGA